MTKPRVEGTPHGRGNSLESRSSVARIEILPVRARVTLLRGPYDYQHPLLSFDKGVGLAVGGLGSGKSEPASLALLRWALRHPRRADGRPTAWYAIGPEFRLIRQEQFGKILEHARHLRELGYPRVVRRVVKGTDPMIELVHGQVILGGSADNPERFRGFEIDGFWGDEVQRWGEKVFRLAYSRLRSAEAPRVVLSASPEDVPSWVWKIVSGKGYNRLRSELIKAGAGLWIHRWISSQNRSNREGTLATIRAVMDESSPTTAAQELEGRFPGTEELPLMGAFDYTCAFSPKIQLSNEDLRPGSLGVDVGETKDFTWITILGATGVVLYMERFNVSTPGVKRETFYPDLERRVEDLARKWGVPIVVIDKAKAGVGVASHVEQRAQGAFVVEAYATDAVGRKAEAVEIYALALSRGDVRIAPELVLPDARTKKVDWVDYLKKELAELTIEDVGFGKRRWNHPVGGHDDGIVSGALAYYGLTKGARCRDDAAGDAPVERSPGLTLGVRALPSLRPKNGVPKL